jgi:hypothetical protein
MEEDDQPKMEVEAAFNILVQLARSNKLTYAEHQKVTIAIETVLGALNRDTVVKETRRLDDEDGE